MFNVNTSSGRLVLMNYSKFVSLKLPWNISNSFSYFNWTDLNRIVLFYEKVTNLNSSWKMILFQEFFHNDGNPIPSLRNNNLSFFNMLGPSSPFSLNFCLNIIKEHFCCCNWDWIVINLITNANNWFVVSQPSNLLYMVSFYSIGLFVRKFYLLLKLFDRVQIVKKNLV